MGNDSWVTRENWDDKYCGNLFMPGSRYIFWVQCLQRKIVCPTKHLTILNAYDWLIDVSNLYKVRRSTYFENSEIFTMFCQEEGIPRVDGHFKERQNRN